MKMIIFLLALLIAPFIVFAQQNVNYDDVAIIVNDNSQVSIDIGTYFQEQRNIPTQNVIYITASVQEEIDSTEFEQIRQQIEVYLTTNNLTNTINYLVTTKGVPLKVKRGEIDPTNTSSYLNCASLDSELSLILGDLSPRIANPGGIKNPYYNADNNFSRDIYGIYLVTRLDGYSKDDVLNLIDRSGPNISVVKSTAQFILDIGDVGSHFDLVDSNLHMVMLIFLIIAFRYITRFS